MNAPKIKYDIEADVKGGASVEDLERHLRELGEALDGDLKTSAVAAADALKSLGEKQAAVTNFQNLKNEAGALAVELEQAQAEVRQLDAQLSKASGTTQQFARAELESKAALDAAKAQLSAARKGYEDLQAGTLGAARKTDEYRQATETACTSIQGLAVEVKQQARSLKEAEASTKAAQQAESALAAQHQKSSAALIQTRGALQDKNAAMDAGREKLRSMGIEAGNLAQAERNLGVAMGAVRQEALGLVPAFAQVAQASTNAASTQEKNGKTMREGLTSISTQLQNIQNIATLALGGGFATGLLKDVADTADAFNNLSARVKLATGEGKAFEDGFARVQQVALGTHSALEGTGVLFSRILQAGKEFNLTQTQALGLTQTINQAVQLSGASAASSDAAITQLIQGLQSGVLRGEEFNSVMEQAPRLAKALADGLGVTTGELRNMAQAGELSTKTVIMALQSQSAAIQGEFTKLPATVGRAITDLQTQWTLFVGKLDSSTGVTSYVAEGINKIAANLDNIARVAGLAGAALTASLAVQGAAALRAYAAEAALAAGATNLLTASINKVPTTVNIVVGVTGFEAGWQIGTMLRENSELARKLGVGMVGYFEVVINSLRLAKEAAAAVFTSDTVDAAFDRYTARNREVRGHMQAMMQDAEQAPAKVGAAVDSASTQIQGLGGSAQAAGAQVAAAGAAGAAGVSAMGKAGADALSIFKALLAEAQKPPAKQGLLDAIAAQLVEARSKGLDLAALLRKELPEALSRLSGPELAAFRVEFIKTMQAAGASSKEVATGLGLIGEQAARSLGVDLVAAGNQVSKTFRDSNEAMRQLILSLPALKEAGVDTGRVVAEALSKMIDSAKSQAEIDLVIGRVNALRTTLGEKLSDSLLEQARQQAQQLREKLDEVTPGINSLSEAMKTLGLESSERLRQTADEAVKAFDVITRAGQQEGESYLAWQARKEEAARAMVQRMIDANRGIVDAAMTARAAAAGLRVDVDESGRAIVRSMREAADATSNAGRAARGAAGDYRGLGQSAAGAAEQIKQLNDMKNRYRMRPVTGNTPEEIQRNAMNEFHDRYRLNGEQSDKDLAEMRKNTSGSVTVSQEYIDQQVAQRYGDEFVGNRMAEQAFTLRAKLAAYRENYGNVVRSQESLNEQHGVMKALERLELEIEAERKKARKAAAPSREQTRAPARSEAPEVANIPTSQHATPSVSPPQPRGAQQSSGGGGSASITPAHGYVPGPTYISNITIPGIGSVSPRFSDTGSQQQVEGILRALVQAQSTAGRR